MIESRRDGKRAGSRRGARQPRFAHRHAFWIALLLFVGYTVLAARAFHLQVTTKDSWMAMSRQRTTRPGWRRGTAPFERGRRGTIFDANGRVLACAFDSFRMYVDQRVVSRAPATRERWTLQGIASVVDQVFRDLDVTFDPGDVRRRIARTPNDIKATSRFVVAGILPAQRRRLQRVLDRLGIRNFRFEPEERRKYPEDDLVSQVVGFVARHADDDSPRARGRAGIELELDDLLAGSDGSFACEWDARRREMDVDGRFLEAPVDGYDVGLTIDSRIQQFVDAALRDAVQGLDYVAATGIVLETQTGRILAMQSLPTYSPENVTTLAATRCRAVEDAYPPGSTFKPFVMARAVEHGIVGWSDEIDTGPGRRAFRYGRGTRILNDTHAHGVLSARDVIVKSSNIGMAVIGFERMGVEGLYDAVESYGFREPPGVLLPHQARGYYTARSVAKKHPLSAVVSIPFGQEIRLSPLALAAKFSIFGTGGIYHEPRIVDWVGRGDERCDRRRDSRRLLAERVADQMREVLVGVVTDGTGRVLRGMPWPVAAKTGTAQILGHPELAGAHSSSMIALAPADDPCITVAVVIYGLKGRRHYGGDVAGPAVRNIIERTLDLLEVPGSRGPRGGPY